MRERRLRRLEGAGGGGGAVDVDLEREEGRGEHQRHLGPAFHLSSHRLKRKAAALFAATARQLAQRSDDWRNLNGEERWYVLLWEDKNDI